MRHQDLTINHRLESWVYANAAARTSATGFVSGDVGRIAYQTDTGEYWRLTAITPTWANIVVLGTVTLQTTPASPVGTTSGAGVMAGLAGTITPVRSGKVFATIAGSIYNNNATGGGSVAIRYGTGTAPANGAALAGTQVGPIAKRGVIAVNERMPFSVSAVITGLALGTSVWLDLVQSNAVAGTTTIENVTISAFELP